MAILYESSKLGSPFVYFWEKKNSNINSMNWFTKPQALPGLHINLNYFQKKKKNSQLVNIWEDKLYSYLWESERNSWLQNLSCNTRRLILHEEEPAVKCSQLKCDKRRQWMVPVHFIITLSHSGVLLTTISTHHSREPVEKFVQTIRTQTFEYRGQMGHISTGILVM